mmetsp:Transcript_18963/g.53868  ORF Transcript_18963/g.53868 Transcript_18963/m.53868 type:complete len:418 (-) Transcript_18963:2292-3545(-)
MVGKAHQHDVFHNAGRLADFVETFRTHLLEALCIGIFQLALGFLLLQILEFLPIFLESGQFLQAGVYDSATEGKSDERNWSASSLAEQQCSGKLLPGLVCTFDRERPVPVNHIGSVHKVGRPCHRREQSIQHGLLQKVLGRPADNIDCEIHHAIAYRLEQLAFPLHGVQFATVCRFEVPHSSKMLGELRFFILLLGKLRGAQISVRDVLPSIRRVRACFLDGAIKVKNVLSAHRVQFHCLHALNVRIVLVIVVCVCVDILFVVVFVILAFAPTAESILFSTLPTSAQPIQRIDRVFDVWFLLWRGGIVAEFDEDVVQQFFLLQRQTPLLLRTAVHGEQMVGVRPVLVAKDIPQLVLFVLPAGQNLGTLRHMLRAVDGVESFQQLDFARELGIRGLQSPRPLIVVAICQPSRQANDAE